MRCRIGSMTGWIRCRDRLAPLVLLVSLARRVRRGPLVRRDRLGLLALSARRVRQGRQVRMARRGL